MVTRSKKDEPRVPFGQVVEAGMIKPGDMLISPCGRHRARVRADGSLAAGEFTGSIHRVGAHVSRAPACNGWTFWHLETAKGPYCIDLFRRDIRKQMAIGAR